MKVGAKMVRVGFVTQVCSNLEKAVTKVLNGMLNKLTNVLDINQDVAIKFYLNPVFGKDYLEARLHGRCYTDTASEHTPSKFVEADESDSMVSIFFSDAVPNDVLEQVYVNKKFHFTIDDTCTPLIYDLVRLECEVNQTACLGKVAPAMAQKFGGDGRVRAVFEATRAPLVKFEQGKATFTGGARANLYVTPAKDVSDAIKAGIEYHEATAAVEISGTVLIKIKDNVVYGSVNVTDVTVHIDEEHNKKWEEKISGIIRDIITKYVNTKFLYKGLPLKLPFGAGFEEPNISFQQGTAQVHSGFAIKNDSQEKK